MDASFVIQDLMSFLDMSPTPWHATQWCRQQLQSHKFIELSLSESSLILPEQCYFLVSHGSLLCAFITPKKLPKRLRLFASHLDSPGFKLKPKPEIRKGGAILLGLEMYGSPLINSWLNRDCGIAGRVFYSTPYGVLRESIVRLDRSPVTIPQLAIHLDREVNEMGLKFNKQEHLLALAALEKDFKESSFLEALLHEEIDFDKLISHDLFLFPLEKARLTGYMGSFLSSYRIDSLASVHAALYALLEHKDPLDDEIKMVLFFDHEEVGSQSTQGANSIFLNHVLERILEGFGGTRQDYHSLIHRSLCISIDLAHALHPSYMEKSEPEHRVIMGQGVALKHNAQQRYATHAKSQVAIRLAAESEQLSLQSFVCRGDIPCGTTIGPIHAAQTGMNTVDIGVGQLSMHSCRELMACQDQFEMTRLLSRLMRMPSSLWPDL